MFDWTSLLEGTPLSERAIQMLDSAPDDRKGAIAQALLFTKHSVAGPDIVGPYPSCYVRARLILGEAPHEIATMLTRREAAQWVQQCTHEDPVAWLWSTLMETYPELSKARVPSNIEVVRWVQEVMGSPTRKEAFLRDRDGVFGGDVAYGSVLSRLDEILPEDLRKSPLDTLEAAVARHIKNMWSGPDQLIKDEPWMKKLPEGTRVLTTFTDLYREGSEMRHCVASYADRVAGGDCLIVSLCKDGNRSTANIVRGKVVEHKGPRNTSPPGVLVDLAENVASFVGSRPRAQTGGQRRL